MKRRLNFFTKDFTKSEKYLIKTTDNLYMTISIEPDYMYYILRKSREVSIEEKR